MHIIKLLLSIGAILISASFTLGQCLIFEGTSPAFEFDIPSGVTVTSVKVKITNYTHGGQHYRSRIRSFQELKTVSVFGNGEYEILTNPITGPSVQDLQVESGIDEFCGFIGDSVAFDWQVIITATGMAGTNINYSGPLTDNLANPDNLGSVFDGQSLVSGAIDLKLTGEGVALYPDYDRDGYGDAFATAVFACGEYCHYDMASNNLDCDDTDENINPDQVDVPNNGIDEDCSGADSTAAIAEPIFTEVTTPFEQVSAGATAWADYDNDGDLDVLITGLGSSGRITKLYENEGNTFSEVVQTPFEAVYQSDVAWADYDQDGDLDVLIAGHDNNSATITKLYQNNNGNFTEETQALFVGVSHCDIAWADYDNDGDPDVMIIGFSDEENRVAKLYENQAGVFVEVSNTPFHPNHNGAIAWADYDSDGRQDIFITEYSTGEASYLYKNQEAGFSSVNEVPFLPVSFSSAAWADYDMDNDPDLLIAGYNSDLGGNVTILYENQEGTFVEVLGTPFTGIDLGAVSWADYDYDGDPDVLISGNNDNNQVTALYNNNNGTFEEVMDVPFPNVSSSDLSWADFDGDGDQDVLISGLNASGRITRLYENQRNPEITIDSAAIPSIVPDQTFVVAENAEAHTTIGVLEINLENQATSLQWKIISGNEDSLFTVEPSGALKIAQSQGLDFETTAQYSLVLTVTHGDYTSAPDTVTIRITDVDEEAPLPTISYQTDTINQVAELTIDFGEIVTGFISEDLYLTDAHLNSMTTQDSAKFQAIITAEIGDSATFSVPESMAFDLAGNPNRASEVYTIFFPGIVTDSVVTDSTVVDEADTLFTLTVEVVSADSALSVPPLLVSLYRKRNRQYEVVFVQEMVNAYLYLEDLEAGEYTLGVLPLDTMFLPAYLGNHLMLGLAHTIQLYQDTVQQLTLLSKPIRQIGRSMISGVLRKANESSEGRIMVSESISEGDVLDQVMLYLLDPQTQKVIGYMFTDEKGRFAFDHLPAGEYLLSVDYQGLPNDEVQNLIRVTDDEEVNVTVLAGSTIRVAQVQSEKQITALPEKLAEDIKFFPNPVVSELSVRVPYAWIGGTIQLSNASGELITTRQIVEPVIQLDFDRIKPGLYIVILQKGDHYKTFKISKH